MFHCRRHFLPLSGSPILRPALWLVWRWSGRSPRCWAWSWRGWSRARLKAAAGKPTAALSPATRYKRPLWGGGAPADGATCCNSFFFFSLFFFKFPKVTLQVKLDANLRFQNRAVRSLPRGVPSVIAVWCYLFSCATMSEEDFPWLCVFKTAKWFVYLDKHVRSNGPLEKNTILLFDTFDGRRMQAHDVLSYLSWIIIKNMATFLLWMITCYLEQTKSRMWFMPFLLHEYKRPNFFYALWYNIAMQIKHKYKTVKGFGSEFV